MLWIGPSAALLIGYLLGSIPFGLLLTRMAGAGDLRAIGSGNIGATNVLRTGRRGLAALTLILDAAKGAAAVLVAQAIRADLGAMAGLAAFFGHCFPIWLGFRGGKGVAIYLGIALALAWPIGLVFAAVWLIALALLRYSSVSGMAAAIGTPVSSFGTASFVPSGIRETSSSSETMLIRPSVRSIDAGNLASPAGRGRAPGSERDKGRRSRDRPSSGQCGRRRFPADLSVHRL